MSADKFELFYCLTRNGWLGPEDNEPVTLPEGWVRVYEVKVSQGSPHGPQSEHWHLRRTNEQFPQQDVTAIELAYPRPNKNDQMARATAKFLRENGAV
jgi:hypothetical protein